MAKKTHKKAIAALSVILAFMTVLFFGTGFMLIANARADLTAHYYPEYERADISSVIQKTEFTDEEYQTLYRQTGLTKLGVDGVLASVYTLQTFQSRMLEFQDAFFADGKIMHDDIGPTTQHDLFYTETDGRWLQYSAPIVPLQKGDVIVSSSCHTFGWRNGHAAIVTDAASGTVLESIAPGENSTLTLGGAYWFCLSSNFVVLRLKAEYRTEIDPAEVATRATQTLYDIPYSLTVGIFSKKDQGESPSSTHCSHLVWQAYKNFGIDIDSDGGPVVTSRDIVHSEYFDVVQVFGFDPLNIW